METARPLVPEDLRASTKVQAADFIATARWLMRSAAEGVPALRLAEAGRANERVRAILKSPIAAGSTSTAAELFDYRTAVGGFLATLKGFNAFDSLLPDMLRLPLRTRIAVVVSGITAGRVGELSVKPFSAMALAGAGLEPVKATGQVILTKELLISASAEAAAVIGTALRTAVAATTDIEFFNLILDGVSPTPSAGSDVAAVRADLSTALDALTTGADSKIYFVVPSPIAKRLSLMGDASGGSAFPNMSPSGGSIGNVPTVVSDGLPDATLAAIDATQLAAGSEGLRLDTSLHATVQVDSAPDSPPTAGTVVESLWPANKVAMRIERFFGAKRLRNGAVSTISGVNYSGNSPG